MPALKALYWHTLRRRVRARNRLLVASVDQPFAYDLWVKAVEKRATQESELRDSIDGWTFLPRFSVLLYTPAGTSPGQLERSIRSVEQQIYPNWSLIQFESRTMASSVLAADGEFLVFLRAGDILADAALFGYAEALQLDRTAALLYSDEDLLDRRLGRVRPWFKPRWNAELFLAQDYLSNSAAIGASLARDIARRKSPKTHAELLLIAALKADRPIVHVPKILCHVAPVPECQSDRIGEVRRLVKPFGATCSFGPFGTIKVKWPLPNELPLVSIIVPTKDKLDLLKPCVEKLLRLTTYENFELLVVDNGSIEQRTIEYLGEISKKPRVRVLSYPAPYNFSAINNFAARDARGAYLCLLNNDTEVVEPTWLTEMMRYAVRPDIGAVGAKLLYDDGSIQHAGVVVGIGEAAGHAHRFLPAGHPGYFRMAHVAQYVSAVTAACLVVQRSKFEAVKGFDEERLAIAFNDVDLCLKLQAAGWKNVYVPHSVLLHHESKSRGNDMAPDQIDRYRRELTVLQERWGTKTYKDPLHNPNLDRYSETFIFRL